MEAPITASPGGSVRRRRRRRKIREQERIKAPPLYVHLSAARFSNSNFLVSRLHIVGEKLRQLEVALAKDEKKVKRKKAKIAWLRGGPGRDQAQKQKEEELKK